MCASSSTAPQLHQTWYDVINRRDCRWWSCNLCEQRAHAADRLLIHAESARPAEHGVHMVYGGLCSAARSQHDSARCFVPAAILTCLRMYTLWQEEGGECLCRCLCGVFYNQALCCLRFRAARQLACGQRQCIAMQKTTAETVSKCVFILYISCLAMGLGHSLGRKEDLHVCPDKASWLMQGLRRERHAQTNQNPKQRHKTPNSRM